MKKSIILILLFHVLSLSSVVAQGTEASDQPKIQLQAGVDELRTLLLDGKAYRKHDNFLFGKTKRAITDVQTSDTTLNIYTDDKYYVIDFQDVIEIRKTIRAVKIDVGCDKDGEGPECNLIDGRKVPDNSGRRLNIDLVRSIPEMKIFLSGGTRRKQCLKLLTEISSLIENIRRET